MHQFILILLLSIVSEQSLSQSQIIQICLSNNIYQHPKFNKTQDLEGIQTRYRGNCRQHIPASKVQQDPRLRRYSDKISGKLSSQTNTQSNDRRYSDDGIEIMSPPGPTKAKGDPRRNKSQTTLKLNEQNTDQPEEENVYNPIKDLYSSRNQQPSQYPKVQHNDTYGQEVYSPTQDVQDMYSKKPKKQNNV